MNKLVTAMLIAGSCLGCGKGSKGGEPDVDCKAIAEHVTNLIHGGTATLPEAQKNATKPFLPALRSQVVASCNEAPKAYAGEVSTCIMNAKNLAQLNTCKPDLAAPSPVPQP